MGCSSKDHEFYAEFKHKEGWSTARVFKAFSWADANGVANIIATRDNTVVTKLRHMSEQCDDDANH